MFLRSEGYSEFVNEGGEVLVPLPSNAVIDYYGWLTNTMREMIIEEANEDGSDDELDNDYDEGQTEANNLFALSQVTISHLQCRITNPH